jgi:2-polyprenyl-3-methyl-5-hydroxy-6-metoxy-1,4-benzoquinol methylase
MDNLKEFWEKVPTKWRHFTTGKNVLTSEKSKRIINRVEKHLFDNVDFNVIKNSLDWGCGGGLLSRELADKCNVNIVDISPTSLENATSFLEGKEFGETILIPNDITNFVYEGEEIDLIFSNEVIQHFPTIEYFNSVINIWKDISPTYFALQIKMDKKTTECKNYKNDFLNGLRFKEEDFIDVFSKIGYNVTYKGYEWTQSRDCKLGYFIFKK